MIKGYHYRASTRLSYQSFDNCLEDEPQVGTTIRQSLAYNPFNVEFFANYPVQSLKLILTNLVIFCPIGLDSQFAIVETILTGILDWKPAWRKFKTIIIGIVCFLGFLFGLPMATGVRAIH